MTTQYCIYCGSNQTETEFNDEHIINNSIGGYETFKICKKHNSFFSDKKACGIDQAIAETFRTLTGLSTTTIDRGTDQKTKILMGNPEFDIYVDHSDGTVSLGASIDHVKKALQGQPNVGDLFFFGEDDKRLKANLIKKFDKEGCGEFNAQFNFQGMSMPLGDMSFYFPLEGKKTLRAIAKIAFNALGSLDAELASSSEFDDIRKFILDGSFFTTKYAFPDYEIVEQGILDRHLIHLVGSAELGILYVSVVLFGCFPYSVLLAENYTGNDFFHVYGMDTKIGKNFDQSKTMESFNRIFKPIYLNRKYFSDRASYLSLNDYLADPEEKPNTLVAKIREHSWKIRSMILNYYREEVVKKVHVKYSKPHD